MTELLWSVAGILIAVFLAYLLAHTWLLRPLVSRVVPGFPFLDRIMPRRMSEGEEAFWEAEMARRRRENGLD